MSRKILHASLFFLAALLISAPAWGSTPADISPVVSDTSLTAETGADFILAEKGWGGPGDCTDPHDGPPEGTGGPNNEDPGGDGQGDKQNQNQNQKGPEGGEQNKGDNAPVG